MKWCNFFNKISLILQALGCAVLYFVIEAICLSLIHILMHFKLKKINMVESLKSVE